MKGGLEMKKLFDVYVRDSYEWMCDKIVDVKEVYSKVDKLNNTLKKVRGGERLQKETEEILTDIGQLFASFDDRLNELSEIVIESETKSRLLADEVKQLEEEKRILEIRLQSLKSNTKYRIEKLMDTNKELIEKESDFSRLENEWSELKDKIDNAISLIETHSKSIATSKNMKSGIGRGNRIEGLDTEDIIKDYISNGMKITKEMREKYNREYGITYHGMMERLKKAGVWRGRQGK